MTNLDNSIWCSKKQSGGRMEQNAFSRMAGFSQSPMLTNNALKDWKWLMLMLYSSILEPKSMKL